MNKTIVYRQAFHIVIDVSKESMSILHFISIGKKRTAFPEGKSMIIFAMHIGYYSLIKKVFDVRIRLK